MSLANQIRKVVWADDALRERFLAEGPRISQMRSAI
jgi:hypothetical protein